MSQTFSTNNALDQLQFVDERAVANLTGLSLATLRRYRLQQRGPNYRKAGTRVLYPLSDLQAWVNSLPSPNDTSAVSNQGVS